MLDVIGWLIFLAALMISVMLHETGHFVAAKRFGMKCTQYFVGFGPTVWSFFRGETEYGIKALPLGGFVKITGMTSIDEVDEEDEPRSFRRAPGWQRRAVRLPPKRSMTLSAKVYRYRPRRCTSPPPTRIRWRGCSTRRAVPAHRKARCSPKAFASEPGSRSPISR